MRSKSSYAPFSVYIRDNLLVVKRSGEDCTRTLCTVDLRRQPTFFLSDAGVMCCDTLGNVFTVESSAHGGNDQLLAALSGAQLQQAEKWCSRWSTRLTIAGALLFVGVMLGIYLEQSLAGAPLVVGPAVSLAPPPLVVPPARSSLASANNVVSPEIPVPVQQARVAAPEDGWALPASVRETLPQKLKSAADRQLFTVNYSSGHDRTLYVFADPNCPNCRYLEPALVAAAHLANVVVFPVAVIGREKSIAAITPVLCLPPAQRLAAWQALFTVGTDGLQLGKQRPVDKKADSACDVAEKALGVNEVAYQTYRIPGTPWVIADDGRYVPQAVLRDPAQLSQFLSEKETLNATH